jgi:predicted amidohydrolase
LVEKASSAGAKALFLPEASDYIASSAKESISLALPVTKSPFVLGLQDAARKEKVAINVGIHEPAETTEDGQPERLKNTLIWIDADGQLVQRYQKLHLFDVEIDGGPILKESESVQPGKAILPPFSTELGNIGQLICFDLRFPEPAISLRRQGAHIITYPSAFTVPTGKAHWEILLRARAIETQSYVVAAAQVGNHNEKRVSYGHSLVVDPWGTVVAELGGEWKGEPELATFEVDHEMLARVRREMPLLRRTDVYPEI